MAEPTAPDQGQASRTGASSRPKKTAASRPNLQPPTPAEKREEGRAAMTIWERLAEPFPQSDLERLPKTLRRDDQDRGRCEEGSRYSADGHWCGGWHARAVHLDYVGHAGITSRLNEVLTPAGWTFGAVAHTPEGLPLMGRGEFWGALTIRDINDPQGGEVTKIDLAANYNGPQEAWGDALRRCAMRFGVGTYLWSKSEAAAEKAKTADPEPEAPPREERRAQEAPPAEKASDITPQAERVAELLRTATQEEKDNLKAWWAQAAGQGAMPPMDAWQAITPHQVGMVEGALAQVREAMAALEAPPDPPQ